jgi:Ca2+/H+ antiporter, TMEM165/GDT1 family
MTAFIASFLFVVLAEMGDKTQLLAMSFASRYKAQQVLIAVFIATALNHGLAVLTGHFLTKIIPIDIISFTASLSFIGFGLWTIQGDTIDDENNKQFKFGPILTVAIAFFLAEMGDKTQLATISLAVKYHNMLGVLCGTTLGMVIADAIGIIIGVVMKKHIPEKIIKWISAIVFIIFGLAGVYSVLDHRISIFYTILIIILITIVTTYFAYSISNKNK